MFCQRRPILLRLVSEHAANCCRQWNLSDRVWLNWNWKGRSRRKRSWARSKITKNQWSRGWWKLSPNAVCSEINWTFSCVCWLRVCFYRLLLLSSWTPAWGLCQNKLERPLRAVWCKCVPKSNDVAPNCLKYSGSCKTRNTTSAKLSLGIRIK